MGDNKTEELRAIIMAHEAQRDSTNRTVDMQIVCPNCMTENPCSRLICWRCGENLEDAKRFQEKAGFRDYSKPKKPASFLLVAFSVGISLLLILAASIFFQVLHPISMIIFIVGIIIGFGLTLLKTSSDWKDSHEGGNSSHSLFPDWLTLPIVLAFGIIVLVVAFGWEFILDWLFSQDVEERVYALIFGGVFGIVIEYSLNYTLQTIRRYKLI